ncbi:hypothetical protein [Streptomyces qinzhouensis]|uniref:Uncharacterized protein n=1 Tax=Streptomyces qinzhouensis TaxID=2599401 RepID=A0A5B8JPF6_9ACTN|nr:hypothetical protein [Streptomyces qinzhouensis]QDY79553.1 hypothetical protein FQU76_26890 [Streptomyces qinzhouensis]
MFSHIGNQAVGRLPVLESTLRAIDGIRVKVETHEEVLFALEARILELERQVRLGAKVHAEHAAAIKEIKSRLSTLMATKTRQQSNLASNAHAAMETFSQEVKQFIEQRLQNVARSRLAYVDGLTEFPQRERLPRLVGGICEILFGEYPPDLNKLRTLLNAPDYGGAFDSLNDTFSKACSFRAKARASEMRCTWHLDFTKGAALDPDRQSPWPSCDSRGRVLFVVAPAFTVDDQLYLVQQVFTG